jgi:hypothetical protein
MATTRKEIERLEEIEKKSFAVRSRFKERPYLQAVYKLYRDWREDGLSTSLSRQAAKMCGIPLREDSHPIRIIIDCSSPNTDEKMRSRWALALRHAYVKRISPSKLLEFLDDEGGVAGRASENRRRKRTASTRRTESHWMARFLAASFKQRKSDLRHGGRITCISTSWQSAVGSVPVCCVESRKQLFGWGHLAVEPKFLQ